MNEQHPQLDYSDLYKFYVSLGIAVIVIPLVLYAYILIRDPKMLSQITYDTLSEYTKTILETKLQAFVLWNSKFLIIQFIALAIGISFLWIGLNQWKERQSIKNKLEEKGLKDTENSEDQTDKMKIEYEDISDVEDNSEKSDSAENNHSEHYSRISQYRLIERSAYEYIKKKYSSRFYFKRNQKLNGILLDCVAISKSNGSDRIFEFSYFTSWESVEMRLAKACGKIMQYARQYQVILHRHVRAVLVIIVPEKNYQETKSKIFSQTCAAPSAYDIMVLSKEKICSEFVNDDMNFL